jgi:HTH-type transcriptional regulator/antitoxin HigA
VAENQRLFEYHPVHPGKILKQLLDEKGWSQDELALITDRRRQTISEIISGKNGVSPDMAVALAAAFGNTPSEWLKWDAAYRLSTLEENGGTNVEKRAKLYQVAPVREMQKRGWIADTKDVNRLENELKTFFDSDALDSTPQFPVATLRRSPFLSPAEWAWCFRARQLARATTHAAVFDRTRLSATEKRLHQLESHPKEARYISEVMAEAGIRFVVVEPLPGTRVDGAAFWLGEESPVIAISGRIDRIDNAWFTVMHEFAHIRNGDALSVDTDILGDDGTPILIRDDIEQQANDAAAASLVPGGELESFMRRVGPLYSKTRIIQFANRIKVHPGIIVGQLQYRKEVGYWAHREMLPKIRENLIETTLTDGWGRSITPGLLGTGRASA